MNFTAQSSKLILIWRMKKELILKRPDALNDANHDLDDGNLRLTGDSSLDVEEIPCSLTIK